MSAEKRRRVADHTWQYEFYIIEDSPYRRLRNRGEDVPSIFDLAPDQVLQMSSNSKLISPRLRVGYVIAPDALVDKLARMAEDTYINARLPEPGHRVRIRATRVAGAAHRRSQGGLHASPQRDC